MQKRDNADWETLLSEQELADELCPMVSIVVPTYNNARSIAITIESLLKQRYPDFEILVVDAGSEDRTLEIVKSYHDERIRLCSVTGYNRYEMVNKGISLSQGLYVNVLFPGDYYIHIDTLRIMMRLAVEQQTPGIVYCGCLLREAHKDVKALYRPLDLNLLKMGQQPTSLQSIWIKNSLFEELGKFNSHLQLRGGFDFLCRFMMSNNPDFASTSRVLTDYDLRGVTKNMVISHFKETFLVLKKHFGIIDACIWLCRQNEVSRYFRLLGKSMKVALFGRE